MSDMQQKMSKTFWQKPEGTTGKIVVAGAAVGGGLLVYKYLPIILAWLTMVLENTLYACVLGAALVVVTSPIWSSKVRTLLGYMARSVLRKVTGWFVEIDPIGILKNYVEDLKKNLAVMDAQIKRLNGAIQHLRGRIEQNAREAKQSAKMAGIAHEQGKKAAFSVQARRAGRREKSNVTLQTLLGKMEALYRLLSKLREVSDVTIQDMDDEVQTKQDERKAILAGYGAFTSAVNILKGAPDQRALYDQALEFLANDYADKVGAIEDFMNVSKGFIESVDLENGVFEAEALEALDKKLDAQTEELLLGNSGKVNRTQVGADGTAFAPARKEASGVRSLYEKN